MLNKLNRLTKTKDFDYVFKKGRSSYDQIIGLKVLDNQLGYSLFCIIVNNKVSKKATERNKIKRQIREVIRLNLDKIHPNKDYIIITLPLIINKNYQNIKESLDKHFIKLHLYI